MFHLRNRQTCVSLHGEALQQPCLKYLCTSATGNMKPLIKGWPLQGHISRMRLFRLFIREVKEIEKTSFTNFLDTWHLIFCISFIFTYVYPQHIFIIDSRSPVTVLACCMVKAIPLQAWTGPEGSRRLRLPDFKTIGT